MTQHLTLASKAKTKFLKYYNKKQTLPLQRQQTNKQTIACATTDKQNFVSKIPLIIFSILIDYYTQLT
jgi:hypothetical protein